MEIKLIYIYILFSLFFYNCKTERTETINIQRNNYEIGFVKISKFNPEVDRYYIESSKINFLHLFYKYDTYKVEIDTNNINTFEDTVSLINEIITLKNKNEFYYRLTIDYYPLPNKFSSYIINAPTKEDLIPLNLFFLYLLENYLNPICSKKKRRIPVLIDTLTNQKKITLINRAYMSLSLFKQKCETNKKIINESILHSANLTFKQYPINRSSF